MTPVATVQRRPAPATYLALADEVERDVAQLPAGTPVPSEHELAGRHGVSRLTARAVLQELERRWVVRRVQGRGTFVAHRIEYRIGPDIPASWTETVRRAGAEPSSTTERVATVRATGWVRRELALPVRATVVHLVRRRTVDGEPATWAESWLPADLVPGLAERLPAEGSLHHVLDEVYGLEPARAWYRAELDVAPDDVAVRLGLRARPLALVLQGRVDSRRLGRPVELTRSWARADLFRIVFEMGSAT